LECPAFGGVNAASIWMHSISMLLVNINVYPPNLLEKPRKIDPGKKEAEKRDKWLNDCPENIYPHHRWNQNQKNQKKRAESFQLGELILILRGK
jgi:hypothetical protein